MKTTLLFLLFWCLASVSLLATTVTDCSTSFFVEDATDGVSLTDACGEINAFVSVINGDIVVSGAGELRINADVGTLNGSILANNTAQILIDFAAVIGTVGGNITLAPGTSMRIDSEISLLSGNINVAAGASLLIIGDIVNMNGTINVDGELEIQGSVTSSGTIDITGTGTTTLDGGTLESTGGGVTIGPDATLDLTNGSTVETDDGIDNDGTITSDGSGNMIDGPGINGDGDQPPVFDGCSGACDDSILPVELVFFRAFEEGPGAALTWQTASELNNDVFEIEKSLDGETFATIGEVMGQGTTNETIDYSFVDFDFRQDAYYRLKQIDFDGSYEYSPIQYLEKSFQDGFLLKHNPVSAARPFQLNLPTDHRISVALVALNGQKVADYIDLTTADAERQISSKLTLLDKGMYVVIVQTAFGTLRERLLVMDVNY